MSPTASGGTVVRFQTVMGDFDVQLFDAAMPRTVTNFLGYVNSDRYNGTAIHRNADVLSGPGAPRDFVIQGGGYRFSDPMPPSSTVSFANVPIDAPILDEPGGGVAGPSNVRGTLAMAKSGPNTVTSQWYINQGDNSFLDDPASPSGGFSAFGAVLGDGMTVVDAIGDLPIPTDFGFSISSPFGNLPLRNFSGNSTFQIRVQHTVTVTSIGVLNLTPGDFDRNGVVDAIDLAILQPNLNVLTTGALLDDGDADMDGDVDQMDFNIWRTHAVPEPCAAALATLGLLGVRRLCRRPCATA